MMKELYVDSSQPQYFFEQAKKEIEKNKNSEMLKVSDHEKEFHKSSYKVIENKNISL